jgi:CBS domain-containing protein
MARAVDTLPADMPADMLADMLADEAVRFFCAGEHRHRSYPVVDADGRLVGIATRADALRWDSEEPHPDQTLNGIVSDASTPLAHPDDRVGLIVDLMIAADIGRVPIVSPDTGVLVGLVARKDLLHLRDAGQSLENERRRYIGAAAKLT